MWRYLICLNNTWQHFTFNLNLINIYFNDKIRSSSIRGDLIEVTNHNHNDTFLSREKDIYRSHYTGYSNGCLLFIFDFINFYYYFLSDMIATTHIMGTFHILSMHVKYKTILTSMMLHLCIFILFYFSFLPFLYCSVSSF